MLIDFIKTIEIREPLVFLSDVLLAAACFYCYFNIKSKAGHLSGQEFSKYWKRFFLFEGISFLIGGMAHGLYAYFGDPLHFLGWYASVVGVFYFAWGMMHASPGVAGKRLGYILFPAMLVSIVTSTVFRAFWVIVAYCFLLMFVVVAINLRSRIISFKSEQSKGILVGTLLFMAAAAIHIFQVRLFGVASQITSHLVIAAGILFFGNGCLETMLEMYEKSKKASEEIPE